MLNLSVVKPPLVEESISVHPEMQDFDLNYPDAELIFGLVYATGSDYAPVLSFLQDQISLSGYRPVEIRISDHFDEAAAKFGVSLDPPDPADPIEYSRINGKIKAGNAIRAQTGRKEVCALIASSKIFSGRTETTEGSPEAHKRTAYLVLSLKRPEEVETLRKIYGAGFFLIGIFAGESDRRKFLTKRKGLSFQKAKDLIERDQKEADPFGQRTRETFQMADVFVSVEREQYEAGLERFLGLAFGDPFTTPTRDEHAMFLAYAASLRSGDLARQVGAALTCSEGEVVALGCNDVPAPGGGLYWSDDGPRDQRDWVKGFDSNDQVKEQLVDDVFARLRDHLKLDENPAVVEAEVRSILSKNSKIGQIAEFGRSVHAEMDALMAAGRTGVVFREATMYTTTFPCHTCTRHIVTAGVKRVVYIEPYPKSRAPDLHDDAIYISGEEHEPSWVIGDRIPFTPFLGIGPRRFFDLFSLKLSAGYSIERKEEGKKIPWDLRTCSRPRVPMPPSSYLEREQLVSTTLNSIQSKEYGTLIPEQQINSGEERQGILGIAGQDGTPSRKLAGMENREPFKRTQT